MHTCVNRTIRRVREQRQKAARARWERDRARRNALAEKDPIFTGLRIARRIIVIDDESRVRETVIYKGDSRRLWLQKQKRALHPIISVSAISSRSGS